MLVGAVTSVSSEKLATCQKRSKKCPRSSCEMLKQKFHLYRSLFLGLLKDLTTMISNGSMFVDELRTARKEVALASFKILHQHVLGWADKYRERARSG